MSFIPRTAWRVWLTGASDRGLDGNALVRGRSAAQLAALAVGRADIFVDQRLELLGDALALQRHGLLAVDIDRRDRPLARSRQADADVRLLALARAVDDATHHG